MATINFKRFGSLDDLAPAVIRERYLKDIKLVDPDGNAWQDEWYFGHIQNAIMEFERETKIPVLPKPIKDERHDYDINDYLNYAWMQLYEWPVRSIEAVTVKYPTGQNVVTFPKEWVNLREEHGQFQLVPTQGTLSQVLIGQGGSFLPVIFNGLSKIPCLWHIDYTAGVDPDNVPWDIIDCISKLAVIAMLSVAADTIIPPGVASTSIGVDGLSQSQSYVNNGQLPPVFSGRIKLYRAEMYGGQGVGDIGQQGKLASLRDQHRGIMMVVA